MVERLAPHFFIHYGTSKDLFLFSSSMKDAWIMKGQQGQYLLLREYPFHHVLECRSAHQKCQECVYTSWYPAGICQDSLLADAINLGCSTSTNTTIIFGKVDLPYGCN